MTLLNSSKIRAMFSENDLTQFQEKGITAFAAEQQLYFFRNGFPYPDIVSPATAERGISIFDENQIQELINEFDSFEGEISKFVPASGAATRMFRSLYDMLISLENGESFQTDTRQICSSVSLIILRFMMNSVNAKTLTKRIKRMF